MCCAWEIAARSRRREQVWAGGEAISAGVWGDVEAMREGRAVFVWLRSGSAAAFRKRFVLEVPAHLSSPGKS